MKKTFKYRIFPTKGQVRKLNKALDACRWLYNRFLEERKTAWEKERKSISRYDQVNSIPKLKKEYEFLNDAYSQCLREVAVRLDLTFRAFFRRLKAGEKPGYPRFKSKSRYNGFTYPQSGFKLFEKTVKFSKIGDIKIKLHRPVQGTIKTCTIKRSPTGKWFVTFVCEVNHNPIEKPIEPTIGVDMGLESFATLSNGEHIRNPRFFKHEEKALVKAQRKLSNQKKASKDRGKARKVVAHIHERISWKRHDFGHQQARKLVNRFNTIVVENLSINDMRQGNFRSINRSIGDVAWRQFLDCLRYKAAWAGSHYIQVNPAYTSQTCFQCGNRHKLKLSDRVYRCPYCGFSLQRDHNAALNILRLGLQSLGSTPRSPRTCSGE